MGKRLWVERNKDGSWDAFSEDGAHIKFGKGRGQFTPGDLMNFVHLKLFGRNGRNSPRVTFLGFRENTSYNHVVQCFRIFD